MEMLLYIIMFWFKVQIWKTNRNKTIMFWLKVQDKLLTFCLVEAERALLNKYITLQRES